MLISSDRHTQKDLELWRELEAADRIHAKRLRPRIEKSLNAIREFCESESYASVSWGKDSTVLAHLVWLAAPHVPLIFVRPQNRLRTPDRDLVRDEFLARFDVIYGEIVVPYSFDEPESDRQFFEAFRSCGTRYLSGIRADESAGRKIRMKNWGIASENTCAPIGWWTTQDVFSYAAVHDLPLCSWYGMLGGGRWDRSRLRVDDLGGTRGDQFGRGEWEQEYYGDVLRRLA